MKIIRYIKNIEKNALGINERNAEYIYPNNPRKSYSLADDKIITKSVLEENSIPHAPTYQVIDKIGNIKNGWEAIQKYEKVAVKPACGRGGGGIKIYKQVKPESWVSSGEIQAKYQIFKHFANILMGVYSFGDNDRVLIEKCIEPHSFFSSIYPAGVPDFRIILLKDKPIMAMLRVPTDKSDGKANLHQGGLGIGIDMVTGKLTTGYDGKSFFNTHPDSGGQILHRDIPFWNDMVDIAIKTSKAFPLNYLGVDIVIDKNCGPLVMEINVRPGLAIQSVNKAGLKSVINNR